MIMLYHLTLEDTQPIKDRSPSVPMFVRLTIPTGFEGLLERLAKEVIRYQPENIYLFAADFFDKEIKRKKAQCTTPSLDIQKDILVVGSREVKDPASLTSSNGLQEDKKVLQNEDQPDGPSSPAEDVDIQNIEDVPSSPVTSETTLKEIEESQLLLKDNDEQIAQATKETSENEMQGNISPQPLAEELSSIISLTDAVIEDRKSPSAESKIYAAEVETNSQLNSPKSITPATPNESEFTESSPDIQNTEEIQISDTEITNVTEKSQGDEVRVHSPDSCIVEERTDKDLESEADDTNAEETLPVDVGNITKTSEPNQDEIILPEENFPLTTSSRPPSTNSIKSSSLENDSGESSTPSVIQISDINSGKENIIIEENMNDTLCDLPDLTETDNLGNEAGETEENKTSETDVNDKINDDAKITDTIVNAKEDLEVETETGEENNETVKIADSPPGDKENIIGVEYSSDTLMSTNNVEIEDAPSEVDSISNLDVKNARESQDESENQLKTEDSMLQNFDTTSAMTNQEIENIIAESSSPEALANENCNEITTNDVPDRSSETALAGSVSPEPDGENRRLSTVTIQSEEIQVKENSRRQSVVSENTSSIKENIATDKDQKVESAAESRIESGHVSVASVSSEKVIDNNESSRCESNVSKNSLTNGEQENDISLDVPVATSTESDAVLQSEDRHSSIESISKEDVDEAVKLQSSVSQNSSATEVTTVESMANLEQETASEMVTLVASSRPDSRHSSQSVDVDNSNIEQTVQDPDDKTCEIQIDENNTTIRTDSKSESDLPNEDTGSPPGSSMSNRNSSTSNAAEKTSPEHDIKEVTENPLNEKEDEVAIIEANAMSVDTRPSSNLSKDSLEGAQVVVVNEMHASPSKSNQEFLELTIAEMEENDSGFLMNPSEEIILEGIDKNSDEVDSDLEVWKKLQAAKSVDSSTEGENNPLSPEQNNTDIKPPSVLIVLNEENNTSIMDSETPDVVNSESLDKEENSKTPHIDDIKDLDPSETPQPDFDYDKLDEEIKNILTEEIPIIESPSKSSVDLEHIPEEDDTSEMDDILLSVDVTPKTQLTDGDILEIVGNLSMNDNETTEEFLTKLNDLTGAKENKTDVTAEIHPEPQDGLDIIKEAIEMPQDISEEKLNQAATTIQSGVRGLLVRRTLEKQRRERIELEAKQIDMPPPAPTFEGRNPILDIIESPVKVRNVVTVEQAVQVVADDGGTILEIAGPPTLDQVNVVQDYLELDFQDIPQGLESEENVALNEAATRIQATFRGFRTRRQISDPNPQPSGRSKKRRHNNPQKSNTEALSESNSDRGLDAAAAKIQAGFRGYRVRKDMKDKLSNGPKSSARQFQAQSACGDDDDKMDTAAKTIQANVRGFLTRKRLKRNRSSRKNSSLEKSNQMEDSENLTPLLDRENSENISKKKQKFSQEYPDDNKQAADAATKIQAGFRGYKCRRNLNCKEKGRPVENKIQLSPLPLAYQPESPVEDMAAAKIQAGFRGFKTRKELKNSRIGRKKSKSESELIIPSSSEDFGDMISLTCSEDDTKKEMDAATKIQAGFRGYQSRKRHKKHKQIKYPDSQSVNNDSLASELIDSLDADSYAASKAATKIQAGFRGYKVRKEIKKKEPVHIFAELERDINSNLDSRTTRAATKIQAGFRGYKVRKDFNRLPGKDVPRNK